MLGIQLRGPVRPCATRVGNMNPSFLQSCALAMRNGSVGYDCPVIISLKQLRTQHSGMSSGQSSSTPKIFSSTVSRLHRNHINGCVGRRCLFSKLTGYAILSKRAMRWSLSRCAALRAHLRASSFRLNRNRKTSPTQECKPSFSLLSARRACASMNIQTMDQRSTRTNTRRAI